MTRRLIAFAPRCQVPAQLDNWCRKNDIEITISASSCVSAAEIHKSEASWVLIDWESKVPFGQPGFLAALREELAGHVVVVTTANGNEEWCEKLGIAGADFVIPKAPSAAEIIGAFRCAMGEYHAKVGVDLTNRQRDVLMAMVSGVTNREMAQQLGVSSKTIESHRAKIFEKLGASNIADAIVLALREGLVTI